MKINRENFLKDLSMVKAGLSPREFIEQSSCFVFQEGSVMTFNDEIACRKKVELNGISGAVQAASLLAILEKLPDGELRVRENPENGQLEFQGERKMFGVTKDAEVFLPIDRVEMPERWRDLPKEFVDAVELVQHCVSTDESRFLLTCIHLHPDHIEACDNLQMMRCKINTGLKNPVLVRGTSLAHITTLGMDEAAMTKSWIHFKNPDGLVFSCRRYAEDYPSLDKIVAFKGHPIVIPKGLKDAADRASVFAADETSGDPHVTVSISNGKIRIRGEGLSGWYKENREVDYDGPSMQFVIAPELLKHISDKYSDAEISDTKLRVTGSRRDREEEGEEEKKRSKLHWVYTTVLGPVAEDNDDKGDNRS